MIDDKDDDFEFIHILPDVPEHKHTRKYLIERELIRLKLKALFTDIQSFNYIEFDSYSGEKELRYDFHNKNYVPYFTTVRIILDYKNDSFIKIVHITYKNKEKYISENFVIKKTDYTEEIILFLFDRFTKNNVFKDDSISVDEI